MKAASIRAGRLARLLALALPLLLTVPAGADETLTYDANGNVQTRSLPGGTTTYGYDDLNRVNSEAGPAKTQSLSYDPNGNRTGDTSGTHTYGGSSDRQLTIAGQSISLDAAGQVTQARGLNFTWNQAGQLKTVSQGATLLATYYYDYRGRRSRKVKEGMSSLSYRTTLYVYDLYDRLISEFNGAGNPLRTYVWRDEIPVALIVHGSETVLYLETDHLNTPIAARNQAGTVVWKWESDAFGSTPANEDPDGDGMLTTINLRFPGQYYDKESGLHYNHHRYYDPKLGRYLSPDPIGLAGGLNLYAYVEGDPLGYADPLGLSRSNPNDPLRGGGGGGSIPLSGPQSIGGLTGGGRGMGGGSGAGVRGPICESPSQSPVWKDFKPYRDGTRTNGQSGKERQYYQWDRTHGDIEAYDRRGSHLGSMNPLSGDMYKPAVPGRVLDGL